ncbi:hypothetical protein KJ781_01825 [Patescibacteria group bacterium]|nr:hypothetical protein [Patescibacteria group bacterium]MBU1448281.1 hypothetical protein [Patescibacteria group bacterium]MBU2613160.1 hypothetical protein [Patescibacteria group bacterium]
MKRYTMCERQTRWLVSHLLDILGSLMLSVGFIGLVGGYWSTPAFSILLCIMGICTHMRKLIRLACLQWHYRHIYQHVVADHAEAIRARHGTGPYRRLAALPPDERVRWLIKNAPDNSNGIRRLVHIENRIASLKASFRDSPKSIF